MREEDGVKSTVSLSVDLTMDQATELKRIAEATRQSISAILERAVDEVIARDALIRARIRAGIASADRGELIPQEDMERWLLSWGTENELPPPG